MPGGVCASAPGAGERGQAGGAGLVRGQEDGVSEFDDLEKKARAYAEEHPEQADKGINEVAGFAERETDHQHDEQIDRAADAAEQHLGQGEDQQGNKD
jgi:MT0933-like antitoxin protein